MGIVCPKCGSGKSLTQTPIYSNQPPNNLIMCAVDCGECDWVGETDELAEGEGE